MNRRETILVFVPAYNCEKQIPRVLAQLQGIEGLFSEILVLDNRSRDRTLEAAKTAAQAIPIPTVIAQNRENYGLGGSHKAAFNYAIAHQFDYCIVLHGDDQADIRDLCPLLEQGMHRTADCLLGARFMPGARLQGYSLFRTLGNHVFNIVFSLVSGHWLWDLGSGLNLYRVEALAKAAFLPFANNLTFNYFMILATVAWKWKIRFFPISWREEDQISNVRLIRQSTEILRILLEFVFRRGNFFSANHSGRESDDYGFDVIYRNAAGTPSDDA